MKEFAIYCPRGWSRIDLTRDEDAIRRQVDAVADRLTRSAPPERRVRARGLVMSRLGQVARSLAEGGAVSIMLPMDDPVVVPIRPVIALAPLQVPEGREPMDVLLSMASADASAEVVDVDGVVALRLSSTDDVTESFVRDAGDLLEQGGATVESDEPSEDRVVARRVRYLIGVPEDPDRWVDILFSIEHLDDQEQRELGDAAIGLFDELAKTFRWTA